MGSSYKWWLGKSQFPPCVISCRGLNSGVYPVERTYCSAFDSGHQRNRVVVGASEPSPVWIPFQHSQSKPRMPLVICTETGEQVWGAPYPHMCLTGCPFDLVHGLAWLLFGNPWCRDLGRFQLKERPCPSWLPVSLHIPQHPLLHHQNAAVPLSRIFLRSQDLDNLKLLRTFLWIIMPESEGNFHVLPQLKNTDPVSLSSLMMGSGVDEWRCVQRNLSWCPWDLPYVPKTHNSDILQLVEPSLGRWPIVEEGQDYSQRQGSSVNWERPKESQSCWVFSPAALAPYQVI